MVDDFVTHQKLGAVFQFFLHVDFHNTKNLVLEVTHAPHDRKGEYLSTTLIHS